MSQPQAQWMFRQFQPSDESFLFSSWLRSYRDSPVMAGVPNTVYYAKMHGAIERVLKSATVLVACAEDDPEQIFGYVVYAPGVIYFAYVKHSLRGFKIGTALESAALVNQTAPIKYACRTRVGERLIAKRAYFSYDPFLMFEGAAT